MNATKTTDDLDALRTVIDAMKDFKPDEQQRIFRWAAEKLGLPQPFTIVSALSVHARHAATPHSEAPAHTPSAAPSTGTAVQDIKSFVATKNPRSDVQFAATVAYYFQFEAPQAERKSSINADDLQDACRKTGRDRLKNPAQTLRNAHTLGMLDKAADPGHFSVNTVGENLVAMTLPGDRTSGDKSEKRSKKKKIKTSANKKAANRTPRAKKMKKA